MTRDIIMDYYSYFYYCVSISTISSTTTTTTKPRNLRKNHHRKHVVALGVPYYLGGVVPTHLTAQRQRLLPKVKPCRVHVGYNHVGASHVGPTVPMRPYVARHVMVPAHCVQRSNS